MKKNNDSYVTKLPLLKFIGLLTILLTFIIFNYILAGNLEMYLNFRINSVLFHNFFFNPDKLGIIGVIQWIGILSLVFIIIEYVIYGLDKLLKNNKSGLSLNPDY